MSSTLTSLPQNTDFGENRLQQSEEQFTPMHWSLREIRASIPDHLFKRELGRSIFYVLRDLAMAGAAWKLATSIDSFTSFSGLVPMALRWSSWLVYWWFQGLIFTGLWVIGHECGHDAFSYHPWLNDILGFVLHTSLLTPYFSWKLSHHRHHINHANMDRDEVYVPKTRSDIAIPGKIMNCEDYIDDTPAFVLFKLIVQQLTAFPAYLSFNISGQKRYPPFTSHFNCNSVLFAPSQRRLVHLSNIGLVIMTYCLILACKMYSATIVLKFYGIPWLLVSHWIVCITYLNHTDPRLPHYRGKEWNFQRGAAATMDRPVLGWQGRFFLHNVAHFHVVHHFFPKLPFYHAKEATHHLRKFLGDHYNFSDVSIWKALWNSYNKCQFVDDEGGVVFYRDKQGKSEIFPASRERWAKDGQLGL